MLTYIPHCPDTGLTGERHGPYGHLIATHFRGVLAVSLMLGVSTAFLGQATVTLTPNPLFNRYNFQYAGTHGVAATGQRLDGDTFQCVWADDNQTYCEVSDSHDNSAMGSGSGASLMIGRFDPTISTFTVVNSFSSYGTFATACVPAVCGWTDPNVTFKSCGMTEIQGTIYACVTRNQKGYPYGSVGATIVESQDHGATWCNPSHASASGCTSSNANGDVPTPSDMQPGNANAIKGLQLISFGKNNTASPPDDNADYAYGYDLSSGVHLGRVPVSVMKALKQSDVQYYSASGGSCPTWGTFACATIIATPDGRIVNPVFLPGPQVYIAAVSNLVDSSGITYQGDSRVMTALHPWGPWHTASEYPSQTEWNFLPDFLTVTETHSGSNWTYKDIESGYYLLTTNRPESNGYSPGTRIATVSPGGPGTTPSSQLITDLRSMPNLLWAYDGEWHATDSWNSVVDVSSSANTNPLAVQEYVSGSNPPVWKGDIATYDKNGLVSFNGTSVDAVGIKQPNGDQTHVLVFRHCCRAPANYEEVMAGNSSANYGVGIDLQRDGTASDKWQVLDFGQGSSDLSLVDGSYHLVVIQQTGTNVNVYTSESISSISGSATPMAHFTTAPGQTPYLTTFGNLGGNTSSANFFQGTLVLSAAYSTSLSQAQIGSLIGKVRTDLINDNVNGFANTKRQVYIPLDFQGTYPLDYQPQPIGSYSIRRMSTNYSGPILRVVTGGGTQTDVTADGSGKINSSLAAACGPGVTCSVMTWYDQSGNGYDLQQATSSYQPVIVQNGTINVDPKGNPTLAFSGTQWMETGTSSLIFVTDSASVHAVAQNSGTFANGGALAFVGNHYSDGLGVGADDMATGMLMGYTSNGYVNAYRDGMGQAELQPTAVGGFFSATSVYDSFSHRMYVDGNAATPVSNGGTQSTGPNHPSEFYAYNFVVGWDKDGSGGGSTDIHWKGNISEVLLYDYAVADSSAKVLRNYDVGFFGTNH